MNKVRITFIACLCLILTLSFVSASSINTYADSSYLAPCASPPHSVYYTPDNAYRTYCSSGFCPSTTHIVEVKHIQESYKQKTIYMRSYIKTKPVFYPYYEEPIKIKSQAIRSMPRPPLYY